MMRDAVISMIKIGRVSALACGLAFMGGGCGGGPKDGETAPQIAQSQGSESAAWAKAKAEGKDKRKNTPAPKNQGGRGYINRPRA